MTNLKPLLSFCVRLQVLCRLIVGLSSASFAADEGKTIELGASVCDRCEASITSPACPLPTVHSSLLASIIAGARDWSAGIAGSPAEQPRWGAILRAINSAQLDKLCAGIENSYECAQAIERHQLQNSENARRVIRRSGQLRLKLNNGRWQTLKDYQKANEEDSVVHYNFREYLPELGYFLVHRQFYEGRDYLMIHEASGRRFQLQDVPVVSPDRRRLVTTSNGIMGGYDPNAIQIWRATSRGLVLEQTIKPQGWGPSDAKWIDNQRVRVTKNLTSEDFSTTRQAPATLILRGSRWRVVQQ